MTGRRKAAKRKKRNMARKRTWASRKEYLVAWRAKNLEKVQVHHALYRARHRVELLKKQQLYLSKPAARKRRLLYQREYRRRVAAGEWIPRRREGIVFPSFEMEEPEWVLVG